MTQLAEQLRRHGFDALVKNLPSGDTSVETKPAPKKVSEKKDWRSKPKSKKAKERRAQTSDAEPTLQPAPVAKLAAPAPSADAKPAITRQQLFASVLVQVTVPSVPFLVTSDFVKEPYYRTVFGTKGGPVFGYFYNLPEGAKPGTKVYAEISIVKKTELINGQKWRTVYVDCHCLTPAEVQTSMEGMPDKLMLVVHSVDTQFEHKPETIFVHHPFGTEGVIEVRKRLPPKPRKEKVEAAPSE